MTKSNLNDSNWKYRQDDQISKMIGGKNEFAHGAPAEQFASAMEDLIHIDSEYAMEVLPALLKDGMTKEKFDEEHDVTAKQKFYGKRFEDTEAKLSIGTLNPDNPISSNIIKDLEKAKTQYGVLYKSAQSAEILSDFMLNIDFLNTTYKAQAEAFKGIEGEEKGTFIESVRGMFKEHIEQDILPNISTDLKQQEKSQGRQ